MAKQLTVKQALASAKKAAKKGDFSLARQMYQAVLDRHPSHMTAQKGLRKLQKAHSGKDIGKQPSPPGDELQRVISLYRSGQMAPAEAGARKILKTCPEEPVALNILGSALQLQGKLDPALEVFDRMIRLNPAEAGNYYNRGITRHNAGRLNGAAEDFRKVLELNPGFAEAYNWLGLTLNSLDQPDTAEKSYTKAIELKPELAEAYNNRALVLGRLGKPIHAIEDCDRAIALNAGLAEPHNIKGGLYSTLGQWEKALESYDKAIELKPEFIEALANKVNALNELGRFEDAVSLSRRVLSLSPDLAQAHYNCGLALFRLGKVREALESFNRAIQFKPDYAKAFCNRGTAFYKLGEMDKAVKDFTRSVDLQPGEAEGYHNLGNIFKDMGDLDRARENLVTANRLDPANPFINRGLSNLKTFTPDDPQIETMKALLQEEKLDTEARVQLCFALAKAFDDIGDYDSGFSYLKEGNRLRKHFLGYDISSDLDWFEKIRQMFDSPMPFAPGEQDAGPRMIFIVGMPRSGTSLVEQILASHTMVFGAGEVGALSTLAKSILAKQPAPAGKGAAVPLTKDEIRGLRQGYFDRLAGLGFSEQVVTDKMPVNFQFIGFMVAAFPGVKIVHLNRDPMATCWSNFKHYFSSSGNGYAYDLDDLAEFFKAYKELMAFWRQRFPDHIYELNYEALTENQEEETRRLLSFCGLPWEEGCLEFHKSRRVVRTASSGQVRKKIYQGSSKVWKNYAHQLKDMASALALE